MRDDQKKKKRYSPCISRMIFILKTVEWILERDNRHPGEVVELTEQSGDLHILNSCNSLSLPICLSTSFESSRLVFSEFANNSGCLQYKLSHGGSVPQRLTLYSSVLSNQSPYLFHYNSVYFWDHILGNKVKELK